MRKGERLILRATVNKPREVVYELDSAPFGVLRLFTVGGHPTLELADGRAFELRLDDRFELTHPDEGPRIAWREEGRLFAPDRITLLTGAKYDLKTKTNKATLKHDRATIARMEIKGSTSLALLEAAIERDEPDEPILAAATSVFLAARPVNRRAYDTAQPQAMDSYGVNPAV